MPVEMHATPGTVMTVEWPDANVTGVMLYSFPVIAVVPVLDWMNILDRVAETALFGKPPAVTAMLSPAWLHTADDTMNGEKPEEDVVMDEDGLKIPIL